MIAAALFWGSVLTVAYVYALYPLAVAALAALFPRRVAADPAHLPTVTLLIAAYNEERCIARKLENALGLEYPPERLQVLVAADGSDDGTAGIVAGFADRGVELLHRPGRSGKMAAIVRAMERARGEIVVFSDANNLYDRDALRRLAAPFADPEVGAVGGAKRIVDDARPLSGSEGLYWRYESFIKERETLLGSCVGGAGEILAIRRRLFRPPPPHVINDDFYICMQIAGCGARVVYEPAARSSEYASASAAGEITRRSRIVAGRYQALLLLPRLVSLRRPLLLWQALSHKFLRPLVPFAMIGALAGNVGMLLAPAPAGPLPLLRGTPPWGAALLAAQGAFYGLALLGARFRGRGALGKLLYLPTFLVQSNFAALLGLAGLFRRGRGVLWKKVARGDEPPPRPKLCIAIWSLGIGGAERVVIMLAKAVPRERYDVSVLCLRERGIYAPELEAAGIPVHCLGKTRKLDVGAFVRLVRHLRRERPDLLNTHLWTADFWGRIAGRIAGVRRIAVTEHNVDAWKSRTRRLLDRALLPVTDAVICVGDEVRDFYVRELGVPAGKAVVIPNPVDVERFADPGGRAAVRAACAIGAGEFVFACVARLHPQKTHDVLLEAVRLLREGGAPPLRLLVVGDGPERPALEGLAARLGLGGTALFLGARADVPAILAAADAFVLSSDYEGTSIAILEAMAAGLPIVASDVGANRSVIGDGDAGYIVPPRDPARLAAAMRRLLDDPAAARAMGRRGREAVRERHGVATATRTTLELFDRLLGRG